MAGAETSWMAPVWKALGWGGSATSGKDSVSDKCNIAESTADRHMHFEPNHSTEIERCASLPARATSPTQPESFPSARSSRASDDDLPYTKNTPLHLLDAQTFVGRFSGDSGIPEGDVPPPSPGATRLRLPDGRDPLRLGDEWREARRRRRALEDCVQCTVAERRASRLRKKLEKKLRGHLAGRVVQGAPYVPNDPERRVMEEVPPDAKPYASAHHVALRREPVASGLCGPKCAVLVKVRHGREDAVAVHVDAVEVEVGSEEGGVQLNPRLLHTAAVADGPVRVEQSMDGRWTTGLCGPFGGPCPLMVQPWLCIKSALLATTLPCVAVGRNRQMLTEDAETGAAATISYLLRCLPIWVVGWLLPPVGIAVCLCCTALGNCKSRGQLRRKYGIRSARFCFVIPCHDCLVHCFCSPCAIAQEFRELHLRLDSPIERVLNVACLDPPPPASMHRGASKTGSRRLSGTATQSVRVANSGTEVFESVSAAQSCNGASQTDASSPSRKTLLQRVVELATKGAQPRLDPDSEVARRVWQARRREFAHNMRTMYVDENAAYLREGVPRVAQPGPLASRTPRKVPGPKEGEFFVPPHDNRSRYDMYGFVNRHHLRLRETARMSCLTTIRETVTRSNHGMVADRPAAPWQPWFLRGDLVVGDVEVARLPRLSEGVDDFDSEEERARLSRVTSWVGTVDERLSGAQTAFSWQTARRGGAAGSIAAAPSRAVQERISAKPSTFSKKKTVVLRQPRGPVSRLSEFSANRRENDTDSSLIRPLSWVKRGKSSRDPEDEVVPWRSAAPAGNVARGSAIGSSMLGALSIPRRLFQRGNRMDSSDEELDMSGAVRGRVEIELEAGSVDSLDDYG
ncbi:unnamed protein product [Pedinophyceae sp. YPF-701]|nr:unnamed protein product [Pedinophyceae sp. YPF-701]